jgi:hypothetical protein
MRLWRINIGHADLYAIDPRRIAINNAVHAATGVAEAELTAHFRRQPVTGIYRRSEELDDARLDLRLIQKKHRARDC